MVASALFLLAALSSSFFTLVRAAAPFPVVADTFTAGTTAKIAWDASTDPGWDVMTVELMGGSNWAMNHLTTVAVNQNGMADGSVQFDVPCINPYGKYYFVRFTSSNTNVAPNYSTRFTIQSSTGETDPTPNMIEPDGSAIPWANGTIVSCSDSSKSSSTSSSSTSTSSSGSSTSTSSSSSSTSTPSSSTSTSSSSTSTSTSSSSSTSSSPSSPTSSPTSGATSSGGRSSSVVLTPAPTPTPAPTGGSTTSGTVTVTETVTITKWGRHPPDSSSRWTTKVTTSTSSQSSSTTTSTSTQAPTPTSNDDTGSPLFTVTPQLDAKRSTNAAASVKRHLGVGSIVTVFIGIGALLY